MYKNLNSQVALGQGYTGVSRKSNTGVTNSNTFCYGTQDGTTHIKFLGIEDFWGNVYGWLDGIYSDTSDLLTDYRNSQMINDGHDFQFSTPKGNAGYSGYIDKIMGTNTSGFTKDYNNGSNGTDSTFLRIVAGLVLAVSVIAAVFGLMVLMRVLSVCFCTIPRRILVRLSGRALCTNTWSLRDSKYNYSDQEYNSMYFK